MIDYSVIQWLDKESSVLEEYHVCPMCKKFYAPNTMVLCGICTFLYTQIHAAVLIKLPLEGYEVCQVLRKTVDDNGTPRIICINQQGHQFYLQNDIEHIL